MEMIISMDGIQNCDKISQIESLQVDIKKLKDHKTLVEKAMALKTKQLLMLLQAIQNETAVA